MCLTEHLPLQNSQAIRIALGCVYWLLGTSVQKKMDLSLFDYSYPLKRSSMEGQGNQFFWLDGERKTPSGKHTADVLAAHALRNHRDTG
jgi:hypothetical protein